MAKVCVAMIVGETAKMEAQTAWDLAALSRHNPHAAILRGVGGSLQDRRHSAVNNSLNSGFDKIVFIDSDMRFPANVIGWLLSIKGDVVAANYKRRHENSWVAATQESVVSSDGRHGIQEVDYIGLGCAMIDLRIFRALPKPWFDMPWAGECHVGEDRFFCDQARKAGYKIFIDHDLSQNIGHIGEVEHWAKGANYATSTAMIEGVILPGEGESHG